MLSNRFSLNFPPWLILAVCLVFAQTPQTCSLSLPTHLEVIDDFRAPNCVWCEGNRGIEYRPSPGGSVASVVDGVVSFVGMVANTMTITKLVGQSKTGGAVEMKMIQEPMAFQPIGVGMKKDEPQLYAKVNEALLALDKAGEINKIWNKWLGPNTEYKMVRDEKVVPLSELKFDPLP